MMNNKNISLRGFVGQEEEEEEEEVTRGDPELYRRGEMGDRVA